MKKIILIVCLFFPALALAADFVPLVGIPRLSGDPSANFSDYINALYRLSISIAALIAVVKIIGAGVKYMFSDIVTSKSDAIADIRGSLLGLLVVIGAVLILSTINKDLTNFTITLAPQAIDDPEPLPDGIADFSDVTTVEEYVAEADRAGLTPVVESTNGVSYVVSNYKLKDASVQEFCTDINGFFIDWWVETGRKCPAYTSEGLQAYIDSTISEVETAACSSLGGGSCTRLFCTGILKDSESCSGECSTLGGGYYDYPGGFYGGDDVCMVPDNLIQPLSNANSAPYTYSGSNVKIWPGWDSSYNGYVLVEYPDAITTNDHELVDCTQIIGNDGQPLCD